ncbi:MAG: formate dehydrogenase subunit gamma [Deltaproteobacteria bacterium]|nr:formate dehydrogenase subunit gamma [Deltaproteobacteria bacterium]
MSKYVERFNTRERVLHWFVTVTFFTQLLSGLGLFSRLFVGYLDLFGGGQGAIMVHKYAGILFLASSLLLFLNHRKEISTLDDDDRVWLSKLGGYLSRDTYEENNGKFNAGQKLFGIFMGASTVILGITGFVIWFPVLLPRSLVQVSLLVHGLIFVLFIMFVIVHIYLATIGNPGTLDGMLWGRVSRIWARKHHVKWYKEITGQEKAS